MVFFNVDQIGVLVDGPHRSGRIPPIDGYGNIQNILRRCRGNADRGAFKIFPQLRFGILRHMGNDFQLGILIAAQDADGGCGGNALPAVGVGDDDAFYIFYDIAAGDDLHPVRNGAQYTSCHGGAIGNGDGFRAAHGRNQFPLQDLDIGLIYLAVTFHGNEVPFLSMMGKIPMRQLTGIFRDGSS